MIQKSRRQTLSVAAQIEQFKIEIRDEEAKLRPKILDRVKLAQDLKAMIQEEAAIEHRINSLKSLIGNLQEFR
jgi:glucose-6-phosphate-specific signal transduction histidine kinase